METNLNLVAFHDKELITTSSIVAKIFGKQHGHVLREIEKIIQKCELLENHHSIFGVMVDGKSAKPCRKGGVERGRCAAGTARACV